MIWHPPAYLAHEDDPRDRAPAAPPPARKPWLTTPTGVYRLTQAGPMPAWPIAERRAP